MGIQKTKRRESKHNTKESHNDKGRAKEEDMTEKNNKNNQETLNKMAITTYLSTSTLNVKWTKCSTQKP